MLRVPKALACLSCLFCFETQSFSSKREKKETSLSVNITVNPVPGMGWPPLHFHFLCKKLEEVETKVNVSLFCCCSSGFLSRKLQVSHYFPVFIRMVPSPSHNLCPWEGVLLRENHYWGVLNITMCRPGCTHSGAGFLLVIWHLFLGHLANCWHHLYSYQLGTELKHINCTGKKEFQDRLS